MSARSDIPLSCRTCSFYLKCFGPQSKAGVLPPDMRPDQLRSRSIQVGTLRTRLLEAGSDGEIVLFIHGEGGRSDRWSYNLQAIANLGYRAIAVDLPGHGLADKDSAFDHSIPGYARFISQLLDELKAPSAVLVGVSLGGAIAARTAIEQSDRISKLIVVAGPGIIPVGREISERLRRLVTFRTREGIIERMRRTFLSPMLVTKDLVNGEFEANTSPGAKDCLGKLGTYLTEGLDVDALHERFAAFAAKHPTLILWGSEDRVMPSSIGAEMARITKGSATLVIIEETGHALPMERPGIFNHHLSDFLKGSHQTFQSVPIESEMRV